MRPASNNRYYKVTSLFIKTAILILSSWYIIKKLYDSAFAHEATDIYYSVDPALLGIVFLLMFVNWGLEAFKWRMLIMPLEQITFMKAQRSVFAGVTVSIFMPNRIGEFAGRIFFLERADKIEATIKNFIGSSAQLLITIICGLISIFLVIDSSFGSFSVSTLISRSYLLIIPVCIILLIFLLAILNRYRDKFRKNIRKYLKVFFDTESTVFINVTILSFLRYSVFLFQYFLVLKAFGVDLDLYTSAVLIAITFFITSIIPSFAFTEVLTRGAVATSLFGLVNIDPSPVVASSLVVWLINLAIPAIIGSAFVWRLKFFNS
jgi:uncharacterized membrane protein YbhN (UPF0104 family)